MPSQRGLSVIKRIARELGFTGHGLACLLGREERTISNYLAGNVIPKTSAHWLTRLKRIEIAPGELKIVLRMPLKYTNRGYPTRATFDLDKSD